MALYSLPSSYPGQADQRRRPAVRGVARQFLARRAAGLLKCRLQHQILGRIAGEIELGRHHDVGPEGCGFFTRSAQTVAVARNVADDRGDLGERDNKTVVARAWGRLSAAREAQANASAHDARPRGIRRTLSSSRTVEIFGFALQAMTATAGESRSPATHSPGRGKSA